MITIPATANKRANGPVRSCLRRPTPNGSPATLRSARGARRQFKDQLAAISCLAPAVKPFAICARNLGSQTTRTISSAISTRNAPMKSSTAKRKSCSAWITAQSDIFTTRLSPTTTKKSTSSPKESTSSRNLTWSSQTPNSWRPPISSQSNAARNSNGSMPLPFSTIWRTRKMYSSSA